MKRIWLILIAVLFVSTVSFPIMYIHYMVGTNSVNEEFFFGVSFGSNKVSEAKLMIDEVKGYTNFILINNWRARIDFTEKYSEIYNWNSIIE